MSALRLLLIVGLLVSAVGADEPAYTCFESVYQDASLDLNAALDRDFVSVLSESAAFTLHRAPRATEMILLDPVAPADRPNPGNRKPGQSGMGAPMVVYAAVGGRVRAYERGQAIDGSQLDEPWLLVSYAGSEDAPFDAPELIVLGNRPQRIAWGDDGSIRATYAQSDTGWIARMQLLGWLKLPNPAATPSAANNPDVWRSEYDSAGWRRDGLPEEIQQKCRYWTRISRAMPVRSRESFSVDRAADAVTTRLDYDWLIVEDAWGTEPLKLAPIQPVLAYTQLYEGFPIEFSVAIRDVDYVTRFGPYMGAEGVDRIEYTIPVGRYVNYATSVDADAVATDIGREALDNIERMMAAKFGPADEHWDEWVYDHGGPQNFVWCFHANNWYARAIPLVSDGVAGNARRLWRQYLADFALTEEAGWISHRGRWVLSGPGSGAWGGFDDRGKLGSTTLLTVWAYAQFTGDWDLIRDRWDFIRGMYNTDLDSASWLGYCRESHAEWGDIGPPSIALARMAWRVGDVDTYNYATYLTGRQLVGHFAVMHGGEYFGRYQPYRDDRAMGEAVFLSNYNLWHGWWVNGPGYVSAVLPPEEQWTNIFVRMASPDLGRFYQDALADRMQWYFNQPLVREWAEACSQRPYLNYQTRERNPDYRQGPFNVNNDSHIRPAEIRLRGLLTDISQAELAEYPGWQGFRGGRGNTSWLISPNYVLLLADPNARRTERVVDEGPATDFIVGHEREHWGERPQGNPDVRWQGNYATLWPQVAIGGNIRMLNFGRTMPAGAENLNAYAGERQVDRTTVIRWCDYVPQTNDGSPQQFTGPWWVIGPFDNEMDDAIEREFGPEAEIDLDAEYPGLEGPVRWRQVEARNGVLDSQAAFGGNWVRMGYHLLVVDSPTEREAVLELGHQGAVKAWLNGEQIRYSHYHHDPYATEQLPVRLQRGQNLLLIKTVSRRGPWRTSGRFLGTDGQPMDDLRYPARPR